MKRDLRIVFMGTPEFAVPSLDILIKNNYNIVGVVASTDKECGRGLQVGMCEIKKYALEKNLNLLQPENLKSREFVKQLTDLKVNLQVVVAFRMLPEAVWKLPEYGTFNLHASLLPQYRGAAPINRAIMNGEKKTGVTTFFINENIDTGKIIFQEETLIGESETASELHDRLKITGAELVLKTVRAIENDSFETIEQSCKAGEMKNLKLAPKIFKKDCKINWNDSVDAIHDFIRGLSCYPSAWTEFVSPDGQKFYFRILSSVKEIQEHSYNPGKIITDGRNYLKISVNRGFIDISSIQQASKKIMSIKEFLRGFCVNEKWKI
ncbi:MAG: methionyl-tRNA formyltransferase [Bacteroidales bacterium]|nr:methionyl-tRNA formyltransferase [Bacteroidales bacterium]